MRLAFEHAELPYDLVAVSHGGEALNYLSGAGEYGNRERFPEPALVLLDLRLPQVDGFEVLRWMRKQSKMPPVLVLSYSRLEEDQRLARELGAALYISKPVDFDSAVALVRSLGGIARPEPDLQPDGTGSSGAEPAIIPDPPGDALGLSNR